MNSCGSHLVIFVAIVFAGVIPATQSTNVSLGGYQDPFAPSSQRTELAMTSESPNLWKKLLVESTQTVSLLAHMVAFSSRADVSVSMASHEPTGGWKCVRQPDSLKASIVQLANMVWDTINVASVNLDEVQQRMKLVPGNIRMSLRTIRRMKLELIPKLLPVYLNAIERSGARAAQLANATVTSVVSTADCIRELQLGVFSTEAGRQRELRKAEMEAQATEVLRKVAEEVLATSREVYEDNEKRIDNAEEKFYEYLDSIPTGWEKIGQDLVKKLGETFIDVFAAVPDLFSNLVKLAGKKDEDGGSSGNQVKEKIQYVSDDMQILGAVKSYPDDIQKLIELFNGNLSSNVEEFEKMKTRLQVLKETWDDSEVGFKQSKIRSRCEQVMREVSSICSAVIGAFKNIECITDSTNTTEPVNEQDGGSEQQGPCITGSQKSGYLTRLQAAKEKFQDLSAAESSLPNGNVQRPQLGGRPMNDAQFKVAQARMNLEKRLDLQVIYRKQVINSMEKLGALNAKLKQIDLTKVDLKKVIELLNEIARALTDMIKYWRSLQRFFYSVQKYARILKDTSKQFAALGRKHTEIVQGGERDLAYRRYMVYTMVVQAHQVNTNSYMVYSMSKTYVQVAQEHLLTPLSEVTQMFTADEDEVSALRDRISRNVDASKAAIKTLMENEDAEFRRKSQAQMEGYNRLINQYGGESEETNARLLAGNQIATEVGMPADDDTDWLEEKK